MVESLVVEREGREDAPARGQGARIVYETLRQAILDLSLEPGSPLDETTLSKQFDMSRTPIREALVRLVADGLARSLPNRNTVVATIDFEQLPVYFEALTLMYRVTTRSAALHRRDIDIPVMRALAANYVDAVTRNDVLGMIQANVDFHMAIAEAGANPYFAQLFRRLLDEGRRILRLYYLSFDGKLPRRFVAEHEEMVLAIAAQDPDRADELGATHGAQIVKQIQSYLVRQTLTGMRIEAPT